MSYRALQFSLIVAVIFSSTTAGKVFAETDIYAGLDVAITHFSGDGPKDTIVYQKGQHFSDQDTKYGVHFGYQISDWLAAEIAYADFGSGMDTFRISPDVYFVNAPMDTQTVRAKGTSIVAVFNHSFASSAPANVFAVLGVATIDYDVAWSGGFSELSGALSTQRSYSDEGLTFGVGAKYALNDVINLRADVRRYDAGNFRLDSFSTGLEVSF